MSKFGSLNDLKKKEEAEENEDAKRNEYYAGGTDNRGGGSGLSVMGPDGRRDIFDQLVQRASQPPPDMSSQPTGQHENCITIALYRNGFRVNDGPLRDPQTPENQEFLRDLQNGAIPRELVRQAGGNASLLDVHLKDNRSEDYVAPSYVAFSGASGSIGSAHSTEGLVFTQPLLSDVADPDNAEPMVSVQVKTITNQRLKLKVSSKASVLQLARIIGRDSHYDQPFTLSAGFPPRDLTDGRQTVAEAGLANAMVTQKKQ